MIRIDLILTVSTSSIKKCKKCFFANFYLTFTVHNVFKGTSYFFSKDLPLGPLFHMLKCFCIKLEVDLAMLMTLLSRKIYFGNLTFYDWASKVIGSIVQE